MATIITADNSSAVLAQLAEQQEHMAETIERVIDQLADQTLRTDRHDEQLRTQAAALRSTAAQLSRTIADTAKAAAKPNNGNPGNSGGGSSAKPNANGRAGASPDNDGGIAGAEVGGKASLGPLAAEAEVGAGLGARRSSQGASARRKWI
jgi:ABC-type transporter Mla subunit MlaD